MTKALPYPSIRWAFNVSNWKPSFEQWKLAVQCVPKEECERCYRFAFVEDCKSSMVGQLLMRKAVNECLGLPYDKIVFSRTSSGKPYLVNRKENFFFNVSHHGNFCVLAAEQNYNVGIDVMKVEHNRNKSVSEFFSLMKKQFSSYEWDFISQPGLEKEQLRRFYRLWCLKESYVKAIGTGIVLDLQTLSFGCRTTIMEESTITTDTKFYEKGRLQPQWKFEESFLGADHCVAVATSPIQGSTDNSRKVEDFATSLTCLSFEDVVKNSVPFETAEESFWEAFLCKDEKKKF